MGGLIGACFNSTNASIFTWRCSRVTSNASKCFEAIVIASLMTLISFLLPVIWNRCTALPVDMEEWSDQEKKLVGELVPLYCNSQTQYSELASLFLTDSDTAIKQLFHFREIGNHTDSTFSSSALFLFLLPYLSMACLTGNFLLVYLCNFHVLSNLLLIFICKLHWNLKLAVIFLKTQEK